VGILNSLNKKLAAFGIAVLCFGYFACYVPYSMMTKMITRGLFDGMNGVGLKGFEIQPVAIFASVVTIVLFISFAGWWKYATQFKLFGRSFPRPRWFTFLGGICLSVQIITTTLAYTFDGISIVFAMLLMRGGVLAMAPVIDTIARRRKRKIYWPSWVAAGLSFGALVVAFAGKAGTAMTTIAAIDISFYLIGYFFRLFIMSNRAKSKDQEERKGYFVEEQMSANVILFSSLIAIALVGSTMAPESIPGMIWRGFTVIPGSTYVGLIYIIGTFSTGTGIFGSLIFLDRRENTFTVPANRCSSIIAGVIATYALAIVYGQRFPSTYQLIGVALIMAAIFFLAYRAIVEKRQRSRQVEEKKAPTLTMQPAIEAE